MKICKLLALFMIPVIFMLSGCNLDLDYIPVFGPQHGINSFIIPDKIFRETVLKAVSALDNNDKESFIDLFTEESRNSDKEFLDDIETLFEIYDQKHTKIGDYDSSSSKGSVSYGVKEYTNHNIFPVLLDDEYFWLDFTVMTVNDSDRTKEGITVFNLYSAQDYCIIRENDNLRLSNVSGINIFCDHRNEFDVITVAEYPYRVLSNTPELKKDEVLNFLEYSNDFYEFKEHFGEPIGDNIFTIYYLENDSDEELFLKVGTNDFEIYGIDVVDNFEWIENFWDEEE